MAKASKAKITKIAKVYWAVAFAAGTALAIVVNGAHAKGASPDPGTWTAVFTAIAPPAMFAVLAEGYFLTRRAVPPRPLRIAGAATLALTTAAFAVSYTTIAAFVNRTPGELPTWVGWVMPGMLDLSVLVAGFLLYVLGEHGATEAPVETREPSAWSLVKRNLATRAVAATAPKIEPSFPQVDEFVNTSGVVREPAGEPVTNPEAVVHEEFVTAYEAVPEGVTKPAAKPKTVVRERPAKSKVAVRDEVPEALKPYLEAAKWMLANRSVTRKTETEVAAMIELIDAGKNSYEVRKALGGSTDTADKVAAAWKQWKSEHETADTITDLERRLTAVG